MKNEKIHTAEQLLYEINKISDKGIFILNKFHILDNINNLIYPVTLSECTNVITGLKIVFLEENFKE